MPMRMVNEFGSKGRGSGATCHAEFSNHVACVLVLRVLILIYDAMAYFMGDGFDVDGGSCGGATTIYVIVE